jgi:hypothetical protein
MPRWALGIFRLISLFKKENKKEKEGKVGEKDKT